MFNCKIAIAKLSAVALVLGMTTAHAVEKTDGSAVASPAGLQSEKGSSSVTRSRYNSSKVVVAAKPIARTTQRVRGGSASAVGAATPTLVHAAVTTKSVSATKRSRYSSNVAANEPIRLADLKQ